MVAAGWVHVVWGFAALWHGELKGVTKVLLALLLSPVAGFYVGFFIHRSMSFLLRGARPAANRYLRAAQFCTAAGLAFSHGANDARKSIGILTLILVLGGYIPRFEVPFWMMIVCAFALTLGHHQQAISLENCQITWFEANRSAVKGRSRVERKRGSRRLGPSALRGLYSLSASQA